MMEDTELTIKALAVFAIAGAISLGDIVNDTYKLNLSAEQIAALSANACIAVIGSITCENVDWDISTLRLFRCKLLAEKYIVELLSEESIYTYVQVQIQEIVEEASYD